MTAQPKGLTSTSSRAAPGVRVLSADGRTAWDACVRRAPGGSVCHLSAWQGVFGATAGQGTRYLMAERDGEVLGVLPLVVVRSRLFGSFLVSLPWVSYGGVCALELDARAALAAASIDVARELGVAYVELHSEEPTIEGFEAHCPKVAMRRDLPADSEALWREFPSKLRAQIRRPEKEGLTAQVGGMEHLDAFYSVFSERMRELGTPVFPRRLFRLVLEAFPDEARICRVDGGGRAVAAALVLGFRDRLEIPWAASLSRYNRLSPNMLLYWQAMRFACEQGFRRFDFGRSTPEGPHFRFKAQWGAVPTPLRYHLWQAAPGPLPERSPESPRYRLAVRAWRRLPLPLTRLIGPLLARNLP